MKMGIQSDRKAASEMLMFRINVRLCQLPISSRYGPRIKICSASFLLMPAPLAIPPALRASIL